MFTAEQYRTKAAEYSELVKTANGPKEVSEFQELERRFTELADNEQWVTDHHDQTLHAPRHEEVGAVLAQPAEAAGNQPAAQADGYDRPLDVRNSAQSSPWQARRFIA